MFNKLNTIFYRIKNIVNKIFRRIKQIFIATDKDSASSNLHYSLLHIISNIMARNNKYHRYSLCIYYFDVTQIMKGYDTQWKVTIRNTFNEHILTKEDIKNIWIDLYNTYKHELYDVLNNCYFNETNQDDKMYFLFVLNNNGNNNYKDILQLNIYNINNAIKFIDNL